MPTAEDAFATTSYEDEVGVRVSPCVEILVTTNAALNEGPHSGWLNFYNSFKAHFGAQVKWYRTNSENRFKKVTPEKLDMVPFWFSDPRNMQENALGVEFKGGNSVRDMRLPSLMFDCTRIWTSPTGVFRMALPLGAGFETLQGILPIVFESLSQFPLLSGYVGYTLYRDTLDFRFERAFFNGNASRLYMRHPGINFADPLYAVPRCLEGLMAVSWLTLLGPLALERLGGISSISAKLRDPCVVMPLGCLGCGALIAAGPRPLIGDLAIGDDLPLYRAVGSVVRDARRPGTFYAEGLDKDVSHEWFMRFFGE